MAELVDEQVRATTLGTAVLRRLGAPAGTTQRENGSRSACSGSVNHSGMNVRSSRPGIVQRLILRGVR
jgi:hypothetical protein